LSVPIESMAHTANQLIKLGADAEVLAPPALRAQLQVTAKRLFRLYAGPGGTTARPRTGRVLKLKGRLASPGTRR
jgi:hypothetical protein